MKNRGQQIYTHDARIKRMVEICPTSGCWNWKGTDRGGYGKMMIGSRSDGSRKSVSAHIVSYQTFVGTVPKGMCVCHKCDNRRCCNPDHLFIGTHKDNAKDMVQKGRWRNGTTGPLPAAPKGNS